MCGRNKVEGAFGTMKCAYGIDTVKARLEETTKTVIGMAVLVFSLKKRLKASLALVLEWLSCMFSTTADGIALWPEPDLFRGAGCGVGSTYGLVEQANIIDKQKTSRYCLTKDN